MVIKLKNKFNKVFVNILLLISSLNPFLRRLILIFLDLCIIAIASYIGLFFLKSSNELNNFSFLKTYSLIAFPSLFVYLFSSNYKSLTQHLGSKYFYRLVIRNTFAMLISAILFCFNTFDISFLKLIILAYGIINLLTVFLRVILRDILIFWLEKKELKKRPIAIYGAGAAGVQLSTLLRLQRKFIVKFFVDDDPKLWNRNINGIDILPPSSIKENVSKISKIILAIPSLPNNKRQDILSNLEKIGIATFQIPSLDKLTSSNVQINDIQPIKIEDLLQRDTVPPISNLIKKIINYNTICITGAGGSIGSELIKQILEFNPKKIVLVEMNELSLYNISKEIEENYTEIDFLPVLGDCSNYKFIKKIFYDNNVDIVFHAAAYKHVPLVEINPIEALKNNIFSTMSVCKAAMSVNLKLMMLISSDKAVRPTNVMGLSKRISELVVQYFASINDNYKIKKTESYTRFSMVRFGNVLGSSGSVLPLFQKQIDSGGPVTLTHPDIVRYFMTIPEAAQLVLQAAQMAKGGDVFLLDMGQAIKIKDFAMKLIKLNGLTIKDESNKNGDIEIIYTGLRTGEKLFEELLVNSKAISTDHPLIYTTSRKSMQNIDNFMNNINKLECELRNYDKSKIISILSEIVPEWQPSKKIKS